MHIYYAKISKYILQWKNRFEILRSTFLILAIRRRLRRPTGNKLQQENSSVSDSSPAASSDSSAVVTSTAVDMETSASVNKFKLRNRVATRKSGTEVSSEKHAVKDNQDDGGYKVLVDFFNKSYN